MPNERKCAHSQCQCAVAEHEKFCSDYCHDAQDVGDIEIQCDCKHEACAL